jgi:cytochrome c peroxidase
MMLRSAATIAALACVLALWSDAIIAQAAPSTGLLDFSETELRSIQRHGPWPPVNGSDAGNRLSGNPQAVALGQQLFFDARLSATGTLSCASCHQPGQAFGDGRARARGLVEVERNTQSLWNAVHERWYGWDGAADSIWSQTFRALTNPREMASNARHVARTIATDAQLACRWNKLFGDDATRDPQATLVDTAKVIGAFTSTLVSASTAFDDFRQAVAHGNTERARQYPLSAQRGLRLFVGRGQCNVCHTGPLFSNGEFADIGRPFFVRPGKVDPGRHGGILTLQSNAYNLLSKWADGPDDETKVKTRHVTIQHRNFGEFKVPSLRNVADTGPYMHDGELTSLSEVVQHYSNLNLDRLHADGEQILKPLALTNSESEDLVAFLRSLSDPDASRWKPKEIAVCGVAPQRQR